jgi:hypothetical protein
MDMAKAKKSKQLSFSMANRVGLLSEISTAIANGKVNMQAICAYAMDGRAYFMLVTENNVKAKKVLSKLRVAAGVEDVLSVEMPNKTGELQKIAKKFADAGIDIDYLYGTAGTGKTSTCIFKTADDSKAMRMINKK